MNRTIPLILIILLLALPASAANEPQNLTAIPFSTYIEFDWDDVGGASHYSVYRYLPAMLWTDETIVLDGIIDSAFTDDGSQRAIALSPNPINPDDFDTFYILRDATWVYMAANTFDNDILEDDTASVYVDFDRDGLTPNVDLQFEIQEDGDVVKRKWTGSSWVSVGGSGSIGAIGNAGTGNPVYELWVPIAELPSFANESWHYILIERSDSHTSPTIFNYQPRNALPTSTANWAPLNITTAANQTFFSYFNITDSEATVLGLTPLDWYRFGFTSTVSGVESNQTTIDVITINTPTYNVSGCVHDEETRVPVVNATVSIEDGFVSDVTVTDVLGRYSFNGLIDDSYHIEFTKKGYNDASKGLIILGSDVDNYDLFMTSLPNNETPRWMYIAIIIIDILLIYYSFTTEDKSYYTDIITSLMSIFFSVLIAYNSFIGVGVYYELSTHAQYITHLLIPFGIIASAMALIMLIFFVVKILELGHQEAEDL